MTKNKTWKRAASAALSLALVTGMLPANVEGFLTRSMGTVGIVASAAPEAITDQSTLTPTETTPSTTERKALGISPLPGKTGSADQFYIRCFSQKAVDRFGTAYDGYIRYSSEKNLDDTIIRYLWIDLDLAQSLTFTDKQGHELSLSDTNYFELHENPYDYEVEAEEDSGGGASIAIESIFDNGYCKVDASKVNIYYSDQVQDTIEWSADSFPTESGSYKLMKDITLDHYTTVYEQNINFDLNGHNILVKTSDSGSSAINPGYEAFEANMHIDAGIFALDSTINITNSANTNGFIYADAGTLSDEVRFSPDSLKKFRRFIYVEDTSGESELTISGGEGTRNIVVTGFNCSAVYSRNGEVNVSNTVFANNNGLNGAALYIETVNMDPSKLLSASLSATNCLFQGNSANLYGGAVYFRGDNANIGDCTFTQNSAAVCGAMYFGSDRDGFTENTVTMTDTAVTNNTAMRFGAIANVPVITSSYTDGNTETYGSHVNYIMEGNVVIRDNMEQLTVNENTNDTQFKSGDLYLYNDPDGEDHESEWTEIGVNGGTDAEGSWTTTMDISGLTEDADIRYCLFKSTSSGKKVMLVPGVLTNELNGDAEANISRLTPSYQIPEGESYFYAQKINDNNQLEVYKKTCTVSNTLYFTNALTDLTKDAAESAEKNTLHNIPSDNKYTDDLKLSDTIYAELTDDDDENSVVQIASVTANNKVYDGNPYNPALSVKKECYAGFTFDVPEYYQIVTEEDGTKKIVSLGTDAPKEKGSYLVSYSVLRGGTAIRNKYLYAPFTIGAKAITDYVVTVDLNHDEMISADEIFGGVKRPDADLTIMGDKYFEANPKLTAEDVISEIEGNRDNSYEFTPISDLEKLYFTGEDYKLNVYPFSVYQNEEGTWKVVQLKEKTTNEDEGDFTVEDNIKSKVGSYEVKVTAPEYVGKKMIPWEINKSKVTDYLVAVDVNHDDRITADELFGTVRQNPESQESVNASDLASAVAGSNADLSEIPAKELIKALAKAEDHTGLNQANVKFNDLADLENVLKYDGQPYELKVQPFSVMKGRNGYSTVMLGADALTIGGTPSKVVAGQYVLEAQSSDYDIAIRAEQGGDVAPTNTIRVPWAIKANESNAKFGMVYDEGTQDYFVSESDEVTVQYTGKPAVIPTFWAVKPDSDYDSNAVYFFVNADNTKLPVNFYHFDAAKSMWVEGMPTAVGNYLVAAIYNGTMDAKGQAKQINRNVKASIDAIRLTIEPAKVNAIVNAESEYGSKLADIKDIKLQSDLTVDGKEISEMVDVTAKLAGTGTKGLVLNAGSYPVELTIKAKEGYEDVLKNFDFGTDDNSGKVIVENAYTVTPKEITEDMVNFTSKYVKPREDGMVNPGDMTVKFDGYDAAGNAQEIVLKNGTDYKTYGATQASGQATYEMDLVGAGKNYTGVATVSWVVDTRSEVEITGKYAEVKSVSYNADNKKLKFNARMTIPDDAVMTKLGIIATSNAAIKYNLTLDTKPEAGVTFVKATTTGLDGIKGTNYTWTKTTVEKDDVWYAVPYVCYKLNGETVTKYGALVEATAEGVTPVELATAEYVRAEYANEKLKFNTLVSIPDGCTMDAIGVCATSNAETAENLTIDTPAVTGETYIKKVDTGLEGITKTGYHWTKTAVKEGTTWFVKPYVTYTDADGVQQTIYGDLEPVKAESEKV